MSFYDYYLPEAFNSASDTYIDKVGGSWRLAPPAACVVCGSRVDAASANSIAGNNPCRCRRSRRARSMSVVELGVDHFFHGDTSDINRHAVASSLPMTYAFAAKTMHCKVEKFRLALLLSFRAAPLRRWCRSTTTSTGCDTRPPDLCWRGRTSSWFPRWAYISSTIYNRDVADPGKIPKRACENWSTSPPSLTQHSARIDGRSDQLSSGRDSAKRDYAGWVPCLESNPTESVRIFLAFVVV